MVCTEYEADSVRVCTEYLWQIVVLGSHSIDNAHNKRLTHEHARLRRSVEGPLGVRWGGWSTSASASDVRLG